VKVFSQKGFSGASTREIARRARVNPTTLFRTFNSKEQLHAAAVDYLIGGLQVRQQIDALAERGDPAPKFIAGVIKTLVDANFHAPEVQRIFLNTALERSAVAFSAVWERLLPIFQRVQARLSEYIAKGELRNVDPLVAARLIIAAGVYHYQDDGVRIYVLGESSAREAAVQILPRKEGWGLHVIAHGRPSHRRLRE
jgi:AcrR family transcriptional regulator